MTPRFLAMTLCGGLLSLLSADMLSGLPPVPINDLAQFTAAHAVASSLLFIGTLTLTGGVLALD